MQPPEHDHSQEHPEEEHAEQLRMREGQHYYPDQFGHRDAGENLQTVTLSQGRNNIATSFFTVMPEKT